MARERSERGFTDECLILSTVTMARDGVFKKEPGHTWTATWRDNRWKKISSIDYSVKLDSENRLVLQPKYDWIDPSSGARLPTEYPVKITTKPGNFGGLRYWFVCPRVTEVGPCQRRVDQLYLPAGERYFGCRICYNLMYRSQRSHDKRRGEIRSEIRKLHIGELPYRCYEALNAASIAFRRFKDLSKKRDKSWHDKSWGESMTPHSIELMHKFQEHIVGAIAIIRLLNKSYRNFSKRERDRRRDVIKERSKGKSFLGPDFKSLAQRMAEQFTKTHHLKK